ncbi:CsbD family protein [Xylophilus sp. GOD-11R]|uniref:CsbD family protein n=1 Tax=Xylophilus sp. GOD-11R TaxID=3089814 RepID=UPI00298C28F9|nr:CsbD family protein [Xylophilus sp. GOD-11R]WPB58149.1 CsbD family protein [Xylophilus sp. GOD-11R]
MTSERTEANWLQFKGKVKEQWGKLTDDDLDVIEGKRDQLIGRIKERHALEHDVATKQVDDWHRQNPTFFFEKS